MIKSLKDLLVNPAGAQAKKTDQILLSPVWGDVGKNDYTTALIEMWAYLLEILSYYNERIINESYIGTARLKESLLSLCNLVNHALDSGVSASAYMATKAEKNKTGIVLAGFKIQTKGTGVTNASGLSKPSTPLVFETDSSILIYDYFNEIGLKVVWDYTYNTFEEGAMSHVLQGKSAYDSFKPDDHGTYLYKQMLSLTRIRLDYIL